jgi:hypothetical protein
VIVAFATAAAIALSGTWDRSPMVLLGHGLVAAVMMATAPAAGATPVLRPPTPWPPPPPAPRCRGPPGHPGGPASPPGQSRPSTNPPLSLPSLPPPPAGSRPARKPTNPTIKENP